MHPYEHGASGGIGQGLFCVGGDRREGTGAGGGVGGGNGGERGQRHPGAGLRGRERVDEGGEDYPELHGHRGPDGVEKVLNVFGDTI